MPLDLNSGRRRPPRPRPPPLARTPARSLALHAPGVKNHSTVHLPPSTLLPWTDTTDKHALESVATAAAIGLVPRSSTLDFFHQLQLSYPILPTDRTDRTYLPYLHPTDRTYLAHPAQTRSTHAPPIHHETYAHNTYSTSRLRSALHIPVYRYPAWNTHRRSRQCVRNQCLHGEAGKISQAAVRCTMGAKRLAPTASTSIP